MKTFMKYFQIVLLSEGHHNSCQAVFGLNGHWIN